MSAASGEVEIRSSRPGDEAAIEALLRASLGKEGDQQYAGFLRWKHQDNPFGPSPAWVATSDGHVVAFRTFLRWELQVGDRVIRAVRAVDTATASSHRGRGLFRQLTLRAVGELVSDGVACVFNTPNDASRPGYLKMGWRELGRVPVGVSFGGPGSVLAMARSRVPAALWSEPCAVGMAAAEVLGDPALVARLVAPPPAGQWTTHRTPEYLAWRYGFEPLRYRALALRDHPDRGIAVFRVRRRGPALEAVICEVLLPSDDRRAARQLVASVRRATGADYTIRVGGGPPCLPRQGPRLVWRPLASDDAPALASWQLALGDLELF